MKKIILITLTLFFVGISFGQKHEFKAKKLHELEKFKQAIIQYNKAIKYNPNSSSLYFNRARCYRKIGEYDKAIIDIDICILLDTNNKEGYKERGAIKAINGEVIEGVKDFSKALEIDSTYAEAYIGRGAAYHLLGEYENSIRDNKKTILLDTLFDASYYNIGLALNELGKYKEAISYFNIAIRIRYNDHQSFFERGRSLFEIEEYKLAEFDFGNAVLYNDKLDPWEEIDNGWSLYHKGLTNLKIGNQTQACKDFEQSYNFGCYQAKLERLKLDCEIVQNELILSKTEEMIEAESIEISPNPIETFAHITINNKISTNNNYSLDILDISGKHIMTIEQISKSYVFSRSDISNGAYLFVIKSNGIILKTEKIILK